ncbi:MAG: TolC family protein [Cyanobacteria bacterium SZAS LIN-5]|nr:TolC family protein [Cyanobacteria bacterium SZAS LIN-5]RTL36701.1 MAG: TolC family protein [Candidatus Melainabacteria bacterium]
MISGFPTNILIAIAVFLYFAMAVLPCRAAGRETPVPDFQFTAQAPTRAITLREAVDTALRNYPAIAQKQFKLRAAKGGVTLAKTQYLPNLNIDIQESEITGNRVASVVMNNVSGFDTVPVDSGPPSQRSSLRPLQNNLQGLNFNWLLIDQGLRHANDNYAYADARAARADVNLVKLDVAFDVANAFLTAAAAKQVIVSTQAALEHMKAADVRARTLVSQGLRPAVDTADWDYEVSKAKIALIKAEKDRRVALAELAEKMGTAAADVDIISDPIISHPTVDVPFHAATDLSAHPLSLLKTAEVSRWRAKEVVLDKAYRPHLWLNASLWGKGSNDSVNPIRPVGGGVLPQVFNYMVGLSYSFPFMEYFPLKAQKEIARSNENAAKADYNLAIQILEKKDVRARIELAQAKKVADETPILVEAARVREIKVSKRYSTGLTNMVSLADAEKALASAQVEDAIAQIDVWRSILALSYVQGDLRPFLQLVDLMQGSNQTRQGS